MSRYTRRTFQVIRLPTASSEGTKNFATTHWPVTIRVSVGRPVQPVARVLQHTRTPRYPGRGAEERDEGMVPTQFPHSPANPRQNWAILLIPDR